MNSDRFLRPPAHNPLHSSLFEFTLRDKEGHVIDVWREHCTFAYALQREQQILKERKALESPGLPVPYTCTAFKIMEEWDGLVAPRA